MIMDTSNLLEIISERFVKPCSPTPPSTCHKLSYKEQIMCHEYIPWAFFYPCPSKSSTEIFELLETSVSKTLTYYYPFAGRLTNNSFVDCHDKGVQFTEARIKCSMNEVLDPPNSPLRDLVFPRFLFSGTSPEDGSLLIVQVSNFDCGGVAVGLCISHKVSDASTRCTLSNDWAAVARQPSYVPTPKFNGASVFPPVDDVSFQELIASPPTENCVAKRFLFKASKIGELKAMASDSGVDRPTRVEVVTALLYRCAMAATRANSGSFRPSMLFNAANLRSITVPPLPQNSIGNFITFFPISTSEEDDTKLSELVHKFRNAKLKLLEEYKEKANANDEFASSLSASENGNETNQNFDVYYSSSWCRFPFYEVDFGFGKPLLVCTTNECGAKNNFILMDTKDGDAIEAAVTLEELDMSIFQGNEELLAFASLVS
ncbi:hypothetical protein ACH5RR_000829 [Cinchona calisaya]|uniref:Acylsugar acyltransferase 3-like n=1 Tax=Cinchona calisaya TaxID=153742 RepID=A0ABD3B2B7_9GENT